MSRPFRQLRQFFAELKRRKVYRVAAGYLVAAFVVLQLADLAAGAFGFPGWFQPMVWVVAGLGFPIAVVLAWAFEVTPEGVRRTPEAEPAEEGASEAGGGLSTGYKVLVGLGLVGAAVAGGWYLTGGGGETPEVSEGTVAVLPFQVSGAGADTWRDGMVSLLSTNLDGAAGIRTIAPRTVFAELEEGGRRLGEVSTEEALAVARRVGARYAVVGSASQLGEELQLTARLHETGSGNRLEQAEVRGSPDSVTALTDSLTRHVLAVLVEEGGDLPSVNLASLTTSSLPALKSYLTAERHFRAGEYGDAVEAYQAAIGQDSTFALAWARLAIAGVFAEGAEEKVQYYRRAYELSDRLPLRERRIVWAAYTREVQDWHMLAADSLRQWTEVYPDDPRIWSALSGTLLTGRVPDGWPEAERALERAIELDPSKASRHSDYVFFALSLHRDSALAARRLDAHPGDRIKEWHQTIWDLKFGDAGRRKAAWARLDTLPGSGMTYGGLLHPTDVELQEQVWQALADRKDTPDGPFSRQVSNWVRGGRLDKIRSTVPGSYWDWSVGCDLAEGLTLGLPIPDSILRSHLAPSRIEQRPSLETVTRLRCSGLYLAERGHEDELKQVLDRLERLRSEAEDRPGIESRARLAVRSLRGYRAWKAGELNRATKLWSGFNDSGSAGAIWRGDLHRELGNLEKARDWYIGAWPHPVTHERLGQIYEAMGRPEKAAAAYRRFIAAWKDADEELQPRVEEARERLQALTASEAEPDE